MTSLIIPDHIAANVTNAGPRVALTIARSRYDKAAREFEAKPSKTKLRMIKEAFDAIEHAFMKVLASDPNRDAIGTCVAKSVRFFGAVTAVEREGFPTFHVSVREGVVKLFREWQAEEKNYAALGFRTVSTLDFLRSLQPLGSSPRIQDPIYNFLMIQRAPDEAPIFHADLFEQQYGVQIREAEAAAAKTAAEALSASEASSEQASASPAEQS